ncbi:hypothetical protein ALC56_09952 [Trachymyrmex septentrionalis]|uniref:Uncharacterized protein n=1 Tax=Trachymyrmex septentrionalis TaxID=34720 RepID=A0A151JU96_9HYME|nr:hypothetical protein ALC56_09952 [Trachymyrmex septentrionalis]
MDLMSTSVIRGPRGDEPNPKISREVQIVPSLGLYGYDDVILCASQNEIIRTSTKTRDMYVLLIMSYLISFLHIIAHKKNDREKELKDDFVNDIVQREHQSQRNKSRKVEAASATWGTNGPRSERIFAVASCPAPQGLPSSNQTSTPETPLVPNESAIQVSFKYLSMVDQQTALERFLFSFLDANIAAIPSITAREENRNLERVTSRGGREPTAAKLERVPSPSPLPKPRRAAPYAAGVVPENASAWKRRVIARYRDNGCWDQNPEERHVTKGERTRDRAYRPFRISS